MTAPRPALSLRRPTQPGEETRVTFMELFFDLVYVFAIIQLSHSLLEHLTWRGALETAVLFLGVWWVWNLTAWATAWLDPDRRPVRLLMAGLMLGSLAMAIAVPSAFGDDAALFAGAYVAVQVVRSAAAAWACRDDAMGANFAQLAVWNALAGAAWLAGAAAHGDARLGWWLAAVALDYLAPLHGFWVPGRGGTDMRTWDLPGAYLAERNRLVLIIAMGETILLFGGTLTGAEVTTPVAVAAGVGFAAIVAVWWVAFGDDRAEGDDHVLEHSDDPTRLARAAFAYGHGAMVAGVIVLAVGIEQVLAHPEGHLGTATALVLAGGPVLYLLGSTLHRATLDGRVPVDRVAGVVALVGVTAALRGVASPVVFAAAVLAVLVGVATAATLQAPQSASVSSSPPGPGG